MLEGDRAMCDSENKKRAWFAARLAACVVSIFLPSLVQANPIGVVRNGFIMITKNVTQAPVKFSINTGALVSNRSIIFGETLEVPLEANIYKVPVLIGGVTVYYDCYISEQPTSVCSVAK